MQHLYLDLKLLMCGINDVTEVFISLWDAHSRQFITEEYYALLTAQGLPQEEERIGKLKTIFPVWLFLHEYLLTLLRISPLNLNLFIYCADSLGWEACK